MRWDSGGLESVDKTTFATVQNDRNVESMSVAQLP
jgi:hypothetical protein